MNSLNWALVVAMGLIGLGCGSDSTSADESREPSLAGTVTPASNTVEETWNLQIELDYDTYSSDSNIKGTVTTSLEAHMAALETRGIKDCRVSEIFRNDDDIKWAHLDVESGYRESTFSVDLQRVRTIFGANEVKIYRPKSGWPYFMLRFDQGRTSEEFESDLKILNGDCTGLSSDAQTECTAQASQAFIKYRSLVKFDNFIAVDVEATLVLDAPPAGLSEGERGSKRAGEVCKKGAILDDTLSELQITFRGASGN